jgi:two-component system cell cycle sensor histidine kinase/response regulator CckA
MRKDGSVFPLEASIKLLDTGDGPPRAISIERDITERKRSEEAIADQARFPSENPYPVLRIASDGTILHANSAATSLLTDQGQSTDGQIPDDWRKYAALAMESGTVERREFQYGKSTFAFHFVPLADAEYVNVYGIDITEQKRIESQFLHAQKMEAVGRLAAGVAHDFNNQLQVILGYCDILMMDRQPGDSLWDSIVQVRQAADRARSTTGHLLAFSRRQILAPKLVDVAELLHDMEKPVGRMIGEDVMLVIAVPPGVQPLFIDQSGLHQAIMNLAVNARDAMPDGGKLVIQASNVALDQAQAAEYPGATPGDYVLLKVIDSGVGMDSETLEHLFEPFFTTKEQGKGTGLGMPMVQGFVAQSDGFIGVDSQVGAGTTIRILLPQAPSDSQANETDETPLRIEKVADCATIMIVEDEQGVRSFLAHLLQRAGYSVQVAAIPSEAMELIQGDGPMPDLIVSDVIMPEMRGDQLAEKMLEVCESLRFLFISGYGNIEVGGHEIMRKPFETAELLERVRKLLLQNY